MDIALEKQIVLKKRTHVTVNRMYSRTHKHICIYSNSSSLGGLQNVLNQLTGSISFFVLPIMDRSMMQGFRSTGGFYYILSGMGLSLIHI